MVDMFKQINIYLRVAWFECRSHSRFINILLALLYLAGRVCLRLGARRNAFNLFCYVHRGTDNKNIKRAIEHHIFKKIHVDLTVNGDACVKLSKLMGKRILILKKCDAQNNEKGVAIVKLTETIALLAQCEHLDKILTHYILILEPSWSGYCSQEILFFAQFKERIYIQAAEQDDYRFIEALDSNLYPLKVGPSHWVDPRVSEKYQHADKQYDIVVNSNWSLWKRHHVLFKALRNLPEDITVALIGMSWKGISVEDIKNIQDYYGVKQQVDYFENISFDRVGQIVSQSKISILLSLKEGSNRSIAEALMCDVPAIVLKDHVGGINSVLNPQNSIRSTDESLAADIENLLFNPLQDVRDNAEMMVSCTETTKKISAIIQQDEQGEGRKWTRDLSVKSNSPRLKYFDHQDDEYYKEESQTFCQLLLGLGVDQY